MSTADAIIPAAATHATPDATEIRRQRGLAIAAVCPIKSEGEPNRYRVPSQCGPGHYYVRYANVDRKRGPSWACTCPDFEERQQPCKHVFAVQFVRKRESKPDGTTTITETMTYAEMTETAESTTRERPTYRQNWTAYNAAQTTEKHRFQVLLAELCKGVAEPARPHDGAKGGRPPVPMADRVFAAAFKVYATVSGRRFACDMKDAQDRGHVTQAPHYNSIARYLESAEMTPILGQLIAESALPLRSIETDFAVDSSGFSSNKFDKWFDRKYGRIKTEHVWVKVHLMCGVKTNIVTAIKIGGPDSPDCPEFTPLVEATAERFEIGEVSADAAYLSYDNFETVANAGGTAYIAFKVNTTAMNGGTYAKMFHLYNLNRDDYLARYHKRSNVESTFSMIKAKFGDAVRSKCPVAMTNESLCKVLCHNLCCLIQSTNELGVEAKFWQEEKGASTRPDNIAADTAVEIWDWI